jgi:dCMP deaminase
MRRHVGAVIVRDRRILATGYNGAPKGLAHCSEIGCLREKMGVPSGRMQELCRGLHAEQNAIIQAALSGVSIENSQIYTVTQPCVVCAKMIINAGIKRIVFDEAYPDPLSEELIKEAKIELVNIKATI